jgi:hypothetical protein
MPDRDNAELWGGLCARARRAIGKVAASKPRSRSNGSAISRRRHGKHARASLYGVSNLER